MPSSPLTLLVIFHPTFSVLLPLSKLLWDQISTTNFSCFSPLAGGLLPPIYTTLADAYTVVHVRDKVEKSQVVLYFIMVFKKKKKMNKYAFEFHDDDVRDEERKRKGFNERNLHKCMRTFEARLGRGWTIFHDDCSFNFAFCFAFFFLLIFELLFIVWIFLHLLCAT